MDIPSETKKMRQGGCVDQYAQAIISADFFWVSSDGDRVIAVDGAQEEGIKSEE
jgi:hypothetical protein